MPRYEVHSFRDEGISKRLESFVLSDRRRRAECSALDAALFAEIGSSTDAAERKRLITARRALRSGREARVANDLKVLSMSSKLSKAFLLWRSALLEDEQILSSWQQLYLSHVQSARARLYSVVQQYDLLKPISVASPSLVTQLYQAKHPVESFRRAEELTLARYFLRAAIKTSPFSSFAFIGATTINDLVKEDRDISISRHVTRAYVNRAVFAGLPDRTPLLSELKANSTLRRSADGAWQWISQNYSVFDAHKIRRETVRKARIRTPLLETILSQQTFLEYVKGQNEPSATHTSTHIKEALAQLSSNGLVLPNASYDALTGNGDILASFGPPSSLIEDVNRYATASPRERCQISSRVSEFRQYLAGGDGRARPEGMLLEDGYADIDAGCYGADSAKLFELVGRVVAPELQINPLYTLMRAHFIKTFGIRGTCSDVMVFLFDLANQMIIRDSKTDSCDMHLPDELVGISILGQRLAAEGSNADAFIVNQAFAGAGWLTARYIGELDHLRNGVKSEFKNWLSKLYSQREIVEVMFSGEANALQHHVPLTERFLRWPLEPLAKMRNQIQLSDVSLVYDEPTNALRLLEKGSHLIAPIYLGGLLPLPSWGPIYFLLLLSTPHLLQPLHHQKPKDHDGMLVEYRPRESRQGVVLRREAWFVRVDYLRTVLHPSKPERMRALRLFLETWRIPTDFFARLVSSNFDRRADRNARKPQYIDSETFFGVELLSEIVALGQETDSIEIFEVLPGRVDHELLKQRYCTESLIEVAVSTHLSQIQSPRT